MSDQAETTWREPKPLDAAYVARIRIERIPLEAMSIEELGRIHQMIRAGDLRHVDEEGGT